MKKLYAAFNGLGKVHNSSSPWVASLLPSGCLKTFLSMHTLFPQTVPLLRLLTRGRPARQDNRFVTKVCVSEIGVSPCNQKVFVDLVFFCSATLKNSGCLQVLQWPFSKKQFGDFLFRDTDRSSLISSRGCTAQVG